MPFFTGTHSLLHAVVMTLTLATNATTGVVAYVEVRMEGDNRSGVIKDQLRALGASVQDRLNQSVTHVIFRDGTKVITYSYTFTHILYGYSFPVSNISC